MLTVGWKEALCVAVFAALVWGAHALLGRISPLTKPAADPRPAANVRRDLLRAAAAFTVAFLVGLFLAPHLLSVTLKLPPQVGDTTPVDALNARYVYLPLLLAIFLSSPAWLALVPSAAFILGGILGALFVFPAAVPFLLDPSRSRAVAGQTAALWDATLGTGLLLLTAPVVYRAAAARLTRLDRPFRRWPFLTPLLMSIAAVATADSSAFRMIVLFLPMCVACMAGIGVAEVVTAHANGRQLAFSRIGVWGLRLMAECLLAALVAAVMVMA